MAEHHELVAEMLILEQMGTQERQKLAKKRRNQQLKRWNQREKEWLAKEKQLNKRLANKLNEENNGLNLKQYTTYSSNHRSKKRTQLAATTGANNNNNNNNNSSLHKNSNHHNNSLKTVSRFHQAASGPKTVGLAPNGRVHFNVGVMLLEAAARNDYDEVKRLLMLGVSPDSVNHDGLTALHQCCIDASEPIMSLLLEFGANVDARDTEQWTPLHAACTCGHLNLVKILVESGADLLAVNGDGNMPFDICEDEATLDYIECQMVKQGITQEMIDLTRASTEMQMITDLEKRIESGAEDSNLALENGVTPLHIAAANGYLSVVKLLIEHGVDVNVCDNDQWRPLHGAACWGNEQHIKVIELLVEAGAHLDAKTSNDETAFDLCDNPELLEKLNQLKDEVANKQAASNSDRLKRTQSKSSSRIHSVRRTSVRDKNQISRREAREEALLRVENSPIVTITNQNTVNNQAPAGGKTDVVHDDNVSTDPANAAPSTGDKVLLKTDQIDGGSSSMLRLDKTQMNSIPCEQTNLDNIITISNDTGRSDQQPQQNGLTNGSHCANGTSIESITSTVIKDTTPAAAALKSNMVRGVSEQTVNNHKIIVEIGGDQSDDRKAGQKTTKPDAKNAVNSNSTNVLISNLAQAQENDSHNSNDTACDSQSNQHHHHLQSTPVLVPFSYTLSNLKKQRSDLRMRTTSIGGSTTTIIIANGTSGASVSLNPKSSLDEHDSGQADEDRPGSPRATIKKFIGEPSEVIGGSKRESRHKCCIVI